MWCFPQGSAEFAIVENGILDHAWQTTEYGENVVRAGWQNLA